MKGLSKMTESLLIDPTKLMRKLLPLLLFVVIGNAAAHAQIRQVYTLVSGNSPAGTLEPAAQFWSDRKGSFEGAYSITPVNVYSVIGGTRYVNRFADYQATGTTTRFRVLFALPADYAAPSMTIQVRADNAAVVYLNGNLVGQQPLMAEVGNFTGPATTFNIGDPAMFRAGANVLEFDLYDYGVFMGLDYKAEIAYDSAVRPVTIDIKPGCNPNNVSPNSSPNGGSGINVPVAILSSATFDATTGLDVSTLRLAGGALARNKKQTPVTSVQDVNGDGLLDLVVYFDGRTLQLDAASFYAFLEGQIVGGTPIQGIDTVSVH